MSSAGTERMLAGLIESSHLRTVDDLPALLAAHTPQAGFTQVLIYLVDLQQEVLRLVNGPGTGGAPEELEVGRGPAGLAFQEVRALPEPGDPESWWVPILNGANRLGVLRVQVADTQLDHAKARHLSSVVALLLTSMRSFSDTFARTIRTRRMNVAAEMQWRLIPPLTFANEWVTVAAMLEPAYEVGGDAFDYAIAGDVLHVSVFDAMGHDVSAGLTANLAVAACRNNRRQDYSLARNTEDIEDVLIAEFGRAQRFVTAIMGDLNLRTGLFTWVNRGHPTPILLRGGRWITTLECLPAHPMGLDLGLSVTTCQEQLEPGDRLIFYTDGITEIRDASGREFGIHRFMEFVIRYQSSGLPVPETLRRLIQAVLTYHKGVLRDDATVVLVEWKGPDADRALEAADWPVPRT
ncbi:PP2C family protein-serine/threonine phosphatase [Herbidospora mongoliensis]|uniref:PP2C family protein-serine/threonine phosphatase n=1 Tax=Herbidospora mongoliensis TaxID=688067 RepID=UPI000A92E8CD|nr:PP2C family protein-serine/threonine phosphatase [Herbidospora mongoliensis]